MYQPKHTHIITSEMEVTSGPQLEEVTLPVTKFNYAYLPGIFSGNMRSNYAAAALGMTREIKFCDSIIRSHLVRFFSRSVSLALFPNPNPFLLFENTDVKVIILKNVHFNASPKSYLKFTRC